MPIVELVTTTNLSPTDAMGFISHLLRGMRPNTIGQILAFDAQQYAAALRLVAVLDAKRHTCRAERVRLELSSSVDENFILGVVFPPLAHEETVSPVTPEPSAGTKRPRQDVADESSGSGTSSSTGSSTSSSAGVQEA